MSATSALYFMDPGSSPLSKPTSQMSLEEASTNIAVYHRAQMLPLWTAMISDFRFFQRDQSPAKCHQAVKDALKDSREPVIYVYDPNFPVSRAKLLLPAPSPPIRSSGRFRWRM